MSRARPAIICPIADADKYARATGIRQHGLLAMMERIVKQEDVCMGENGLKV